MTVEIQTRTGQGKAWRTLGQLLNVFFTNNPLSSDQIDFIPGSIPGDALAPGAVQANAPQYIDSKGPSLGFTPSTTFQTVFDLSTNAGLDAGDEAFIFLSAKLKGKISGTRTRTAQVIVELDGVVIAQVSVPFKSTKNKVITRSTATIFSATSDLEGTLRVRLRETSNKLTVAPGGAAVSCYVTMPDSA